MSAAFLNQSTAIGVSGGSTGIGHTLRRLLYVADVPVESSYHGSALIYRLLETYPSERLMIIEPDHGMSLPQRRLPQVAYRSLRLGSQRFRDTRFHRWHALLMSLK